MFSLTMEVYFKSIKAFSAKDFPLDLRSLHLSFLFHLIFFRVFKFWFHIMSIKKCRHIYITTLNVRSISMQNFKTIVTENQILVMEFSESLIKIEFLDSH